MEQVSVDEAYLDVTSDTSADYLAAENIARRIKQEILDSEKLTCSVGIGPNKLVAKMAVDAKKPDGLTAVLPDRVRSFLNPMPVGKLFGVGPKTEQKLGALGIATVEDLANFDEDMLAKELGRNLGPQLRRSARGVNDDPVREREREQLSRIITLKQHADKFDFASEIEPLCKDISNRLAAMGLLCKSVGIIAITDGLKMKNRARALDVPTNSEEKILSVSSELFETFLAENQEMSLRRVGIRVSGLAKATAQKDSSLTEFFG
jgi:DNA polymerase IV (DinB-like DNA polymerase)